MPKNEEGEFELILGNRQLLSVFFIVVALLSVFFTMGYIVGRNSAPVIASDSSRKGDAKPLVVDSKVSPPDTTPAPASAPKETAVQQPEPAKSEPTKSEPTPGAEPQRETPKEVAKAEPKSEPKAEPEKATKSKAELNAEGREKAKKEKAEVARTEAKQEKAKPALGQPSGSYLQLAATTPHEAEAVVEVLRKKDFKAISAEVPEKPGLFRVLVGPIPDGAVNKTRADLSAAGFPGDKAIRRNF
jgi:outer membrane biosynthesis protein TonB